MAEIRGTTYEDVYAVNVCKVKAMCAGGEGSATAYTEQ